MTNAQGFAASLVRAIMAGRWSHDPPSWCDHDDYDSSNADWDDSGSYDYTRAVQTAEAFITLFTKLDANFDEAVFLRECGFALPLPKDGAE
jgi:hypothetical protein